MAPTEESDDDRDSPERIGLPRRCGARLWRHRIKENEEAKRGLRWGIYCGVGKKGRFDAHGVRRDDHGLGIQHGVLGQGGLGLLRGEE